MVVAAAIYLLNFYSGSFMCQAAVWIISELRSRRKNGTLLFVNMTPAPELSFFMAPAPVRFHPLIF